MSEEARPDRKRWMRMSLKGNKPTITREDYAVMTYDDLCAASVRIDGRHPGDDADDIERQRLAANYARHRVLGYDIVIASLHSRWKMPKRFSLDIFIDAMRVITERWPELKDERSRAIARKKADKTMADTLTHRNPRPAPIDGLRAGMTVLVEGVEVRILRLTQAKVIYERMFAGAMTRLSEPRVIFVARLVTA